MAELAQMGSDAADDAPLEEPSPRHRPLLPVFAGFALGVALDNALALSLALWAVLACWLVWLAACAAVRGMKPWGNWALALLLFAPVGGAYHHARFREKPAWHLFNLPLAEHSLYHVRGTVTAEPSSFFQEVPLGLEDDEPGEFWLVRVELKGISGDGSDWRRAAGGMAVFVREAFPGVMPGDTVEFLSFVQKNRPPTNPGQRDQSKAFMRAGSYATGAVATAAAFKTTSKSPWYDLRFAASRLRAHLKSKLMWDAPRNVSGLTSALIFGEQGRIKPHLDELLKDSGTLHFLAISGLHVGIFAGLVWLVLIRTGLGVRPRSVVLIALVWLYVLFTGARVSALRAGCMVSFTACAPLLRRRYDLLSSMAAAALVILLFNPGQLFSAGFQLTFAAVWAIAYLYGHLSKILWPWEGFVWRAQQPQERSLRADVWFYVRHYVLLSLCVWIATAPLMAYHFNRVSLMTPFISLFLWPLILPLLVCAFLLSAFALAGLPGTGLLVACTNFFSAGIEVLLAEASRLPGFVHYTAGPLAWWVGAFYVAAGLWVLRWRIRGGRAIFVLAAAALAVSYIWADYGRGGLDCFRMIVTDVGHGAAVIMRCKDGGTVLYDAGSYRTSARKAVAEVLWDQGVKWIDQLIISHRDLDHCRFFPYLAARFRIGRAAIPPACPITDVGRRLGKAFERADLKEVNLSEGERIVGNALDCLALHPDRRFIENPSVTENDKSLVLLCTFGSCRFLLTGDIEQLSMDRLTEEHGDSLRADVLQLPHHGAREEGLKEFVELCSPKAAVATCGASTDLRKTKQILRELGVPLWTTVEDGAIIIEVRDAELTVRGHKSGRRMAFDLSEWPTVSGVNEPRSP